jgi:hypothetical protein
LGLQLPGNDYEPLGYRTAKQQSSPRRY